MKAGEKAHGKTGAGEKWGLFANGIVVSILGCLNQWLAAKIKNAPWEKFADPPAAPGVLSGCGGGMPAGGGIACGENHPAGGFQIEHDRRSHRSRSHLQPVSAPRKLVPRAFAHGVVDC